MSQGEHDITCIREGCDRPISRRGLCHAHYEHAAKQIKLGRTSWPELIKAGKARNAMSPAERDQRMREGWL